VEDVQTVDTDEVVEASTALEIASKEEASEVDLTTYPEVAEEEVSEAEKTLEGLP
jgi:hypothetical protein